MNDLYVLTNHVNKESLDWFRECRILTLRDAFSDPSSREKSYDLAIEVQESSIPIKYTDTYQIPFFRSSSIKKTYESITKRIMQGEEKRFLVNMGEEEQPKLFDVLPKKTEIESVEYRLATLDEISSYIGKEQFRHLQERLAKI